MSNVNINFEEDKQNQLKLSSDDDKKTLSQQVEKLKSLEDKLKKAESDLKKLKQEADALSNDIIPTMMTEMNISTIKLADGTAVEVKPVYGASIPIDKKEEAYNWLRSNGLGDLIKNEVTVSFGRNEDNKAAEYAVLAKGQGYEPVQKVGVHPQTLKGVVRECNESGIELPDCFKTYVGNRTNIKRS